MRNFLFVMLALLLAHFSMMPSLYGYNSGVVIFCAVLYALLFSFRLYFSSKFYAGSYYSPMRPDILFLVFYCLVFMVPYIQAIDDSGFLYENKFINNLFLDYSSRAIMVATAYSFAFVFGSFVGDSSGVCLERYFAPSDFMGISIFAYRLNLVLMMFSMVAFELTGASSMMSGEYTGLGGGNSTFDGIYFLITQFAMAAAAIFIIGLGAGVNLWGWGDKLFQLGIIFWMIRLLASGDRNNFLLIIIVYIVGFATYVKKVRFPVMIFIGFAGWLVYQVVEVTRASGARSIVDFIEAINRSGFGIEDQNISESSISLTTTTLRASLALQPFGEAIYNGWFKLVGFMGVMPYSRQLLPMPEDGFYTSAQVITDQVLGYNPTWSLGSNVVSDVMLDFGIYGGSVLMIFLGFLSSMFIKNARGQSMPVSSALYLLLASLLFQMPRYSYDFPVRNLFWFFVVYFMAAFAASIKNKNNS